MNHGPAAIDDVTVCHPGGADRFAGSAAQAVIEVILHVRIERQAAVYQPLDQCNAAAGRFALIAADLIGGAVWQAHAAHHAAVGGLEQLRVAVVGLQGEQ